MKTIILGSDGLLTNSIKKVLKDINIFSARDSTSIDYICEFLNSLKKYNLIFNNFYPSKNLNSIDEKNYFNFVNQGIQFNTKLLQRINHKKINKIIYTSSAAVNKLSVLNGKKVRDIYASSKLLNESILYSYAEKHKKILFICRIHNFYSEKKDNFSFVSKLLDKKKYKYVQLNNSGNAVRDFIHVNDVAKIYAKLIKKKVSVSNYKINIGTGKGIKLIDIYYNLKNKRNFKFSDSKFNEEDISVSDNYVLNQLIGEYNFVKLDKFLSKKFNKKIYLPKIPYLKTLENKSKYLNGSFIFGAGIAGKQIYKILKNKSEHIIAFIDDDKKKINKEIDGIKIISFKDLIGISRKYFIKKIYISLPSISEIKILQLEKKLRKISNEIIIIPRRNILKDKYQVSIEDITNFDIKKILGRNEIIENKIKNFSNLKELNILVTGGAGSIGSEIVRQLIKIKPKSIHVIDNSEFALSNFKIELNNKYKNTFFNLLDVKDFLNINNYIAKNNINLIFHAAAFKHVEMLENNILPAINNNIFGTYNVLKSANSNSSNVILISTDKAVKPKNVLGYTKRISEIICELFNDNKIDIKIVRFGNVLGSNGSAVPLFLRQLNNNEPITLTSYDAKRFFMTIREACYLVLETTKLKNRNNLYVLNMGTELKIYDLINNLSEVYRKFNPSFNKTNINLTGLKKGEKLREKLFLGKKYKTKNKNIFSIKEKKFKKDEIKKFIFDIGNSLNKYSERVLLRKIKNFIK